MSTLEQQLRAAAVLAGLCHDLGKADPSFQRMLREEPVAGTPVRHEQWSAWLMHQMIKTGGRLSAEDWTHFWQNPEQAMPQPPVTPYGWAMWAVMTHHRLPEYDKAHNTWVPLWQKESGRWRGAAPEQTTPMDNAAWKAAFQRATAELGAEVFQTPQPSTPTEAAMVAAWADIRQALMLADHTVSARNLTLEERNFGNHPDWEGLFANSQPQPGPYPPEKTSRTESHPLMPHLLAVGGEAGRMMDRLRSFSTRKKLPGVRDKTWMDEKKLSGNPRFSWQDQLQEVLKKHAGVMGVFGVIAADTGAGKTMGAAKGLSALTNQDMPRRWNLLLGLRTLTEQSGRAYRSGLNLEEDEVAVVMGQSYVDPTGNPGAFGNQEPAEWTVWAEQKKTLHEDFGLGVVTQNKTGQVLLSAPVLVATIDQIMKAADPRRTFHELAQLRLRVSDTILDEIDSYSPADWPALARLCRWIGILGGRLFVVSATAPPGLVQQLGRAYGEGFAARGALEGYDRPSKMVLVAAADRGLSSVHCDTVKVSDILNPNTPHVVQNFYLQAVDGWEQERKTKACPWAIGRKMERLAKLSGLDCEKSAREMVASTSPQDFTDSPWMDWVKDFHGRSNTRLTTENRTVSISRGLVRLSRTRDVGRLAAGLARATWPAGWEVRVVGYHSRLVHGIRRMVEETLDATLGPDGAKWRQSGEEGQWYVHDQTGLSESLKVWGIHTISPAITHIVLLVVASPVEEVGRDHDFDWALLEPITPQTLIQAAGRVFRHRPLPSPESRAVIGVLEESLNRIKAHDPKTAGGRMCRKNIPEWPSFLSQGKNKLAPWDLANEWLSEAHGHHMRSATMKGQDWPSQTQLIWTSRAEDLRAGVSAWEMKSGWFDERHPLDFGFRDSEPNERHCLVRNKDNTVEWQVEVGKGRGKTLEEDKGWIASDSQNQTLSLPIQANVVFLNEALWNQLAARGLGSVNPEDLFIQTSRQNPKKVQKICPWLGNTDEGF